MKEIGYKISDVLGKYKVLLYNNYKVYFKVYPITTKFIHNEIWDSSRRLKCEVDDSVRILNERD